MNAGAHTSGLVGAASEAPGSDARLTPADLADLLGKFNEVTARLQSAHDSLRGEVARLTRELGEASAQLERSRRLAALGEMAAGIAHEVRNPLGGIRLYARMLEEDLADRPAEQATVRKIAGAARDMEGIVGDVLTFAKEFKLRPAPLCAGALLERSLEACRHDGVPGWRRVEIECIGACEGPEFEADGALLQQAMTNIIRNAIEAMHEVMQEAERAGHAGHAGRGDAPAHRLTLSATTRRVVWNDQRSGEAVVLSVRDTGPGVTPDVVKRMFNPFFTTRGAGTGLGLAIVHRIVDAHGGRMVVRNNSELDAERVSAGRRRKGEKQDRTDRPRDVRGATVEVLLPVAGLRAGAGFENVEVMVGQGLRGPMGVEMSA